MENTAILCIFAPSNITAMIQEIKIKNFLSFKEEVTFSFEATNAGDRKKQTSAIDSPDYSRTNDPLLINVAEKTDLLRFAVIYGANAAGKTNLLSAFGFLLRFLTQKPTYADSGTGVQNFALDNAWQTKPSEFNLRFFIDEQRYWYQLILNKTEVIEENLFIYKTRQPSNVFKRKDGIIEFNPQIEPIDSIVLKQLNINCLRNMSLFVARKTINAKIPIVDTIVEWLDSDMTEVIEDSYEFFNIAEQLVQGNPELTEHLFNFLQEADFNITGIDSEVEKTEIPEDVIKAIVSDPKAPEDLKQQLLVDKYMPAVKTYFHHETTNNGIKEDHRFPSSWQSRGTKNVFSIETLLYITEHKPDSLIAIDELERSLHPDLMHYIIKKFILQKGNRSQLLISSHFTPLLDMEGLRNDCFWFAEKNKETGSTSLTPLTKKKALNRRKSKEDTYLKTDNVGARPNINDPEI